MNQLVQTAQNLPANIEDLAKFVLVGREKLTSVRAEIRAIDKLNLAEEVRTQKKEEALMLSEALLDAEVRIGELTRALPKVPKINNLRNDTGVASGKMVCDTAIVSEYNHSVHQCTKCEDFKNRVDAKFEKPKLEVIRGLGLNPKQVERFETLANNPDIVEQVKSIAAC